MPASANVQNTRSCAYDNLRGLLIFCVVFAHLLEKAPGFPLGTVLYRAIYTFHMPAFLFLFGLFARFHPRRIVFSFALPYLVFQALYILFDRLASGSAAAMQFTTPYWLMWFLMVCIFYQLLIPFFDTDSRRVQAFWVCAAFVLALLIGYEKSVSYYLSLSRFFVFLPWFLLGLYCGKHRAAIEGRARSAKPLFCLPVLLLTLAAAVFIHHFPGLTSAMFYGSYPYASLGYTPLTRLVLMLGATLWLLLLLLFSLRLMNRPIPLLTCLGRNTLPVFLLHGFVVRGLPVLAPDVLRHPLAVLGLAFGMLLLFGNPWVGKAFRWVFSDRWVAGKR